MGVRTQGRRIALEGGTLVMTETNGKATGERAGADVMEMWRSWLTETERQWNGFFNQVMGTDSFGRVAGSCMDGYAVLQRTLNQGMERYLTTFNLPTHSDITEIGERLHNIEERLGKLGADINNLFSGRGKSPTPPPPPLPP